MATSESGATESAVRELRVAVVLNGGVSLAVWMGGSARELHAAATAAPSGGDAADGVTSAELWATLLDEAGLRLSVDVVAGTSAGGLNGMLMASCLALGAPYPDMKSRWRKLPRLERHALFRGMDDDASGQSILDGGYFAEEVVKIFQELKATPSQSRDVACLVTSTAIGGAPRVLVDDFGAVQNVSDHRRVYQFLSQKVHYEFDVDKQQILRQKPVNHFVDKATVASAARASAGFPAAFEPVKESLALKEQRKVGEGDWTWLMDGGVLDNAAFEPLLDAVRERPVDGPWRRVVAYLVPQSGDLAVGEGGVDPPRPALPRVLSSVVSSWREIDSRLDLDALEAYRRVTGNSTTSPHQLLAEARRRQRMGPEPSWILAAGGLFDLYVETRVRAASSLEAIPAQNLGTAFLQPPEGATRVERARRLPFIPSELAASEGDWQWGLGTALRLIRWWARDLNSVEPPDARALKRLGHLQAQLQAMAETAEVVRRDIDVQARNGATFVPDDQESNLSRLEEWCADSRVEPVFVKAGELALEGAKVYALAANVGFEWALDTALRVEVLLHATLWEDAIPDRPPMKYLRMGPDVPSSAASQDVRKKTNWGSRKLYGTTLGHFGAFVDEGWRVSDWTWGRLDAAAHLVKLVASEAEAGMVNVEAWTDRLQAAILREEETDLKTWHRDSLEMLEHYGNEKSIDNVIEHLRSNAQGQASLEALVDEVLVTLAQTAAVKPGLLAKAGMFLRRALHLEKRRPSDLKRISFARAAGFMPRWLMRRWIHNSK